MTEDEVEDCIKWATDSLHRESYSRRHRLVKCRSYLEDAIDCLEQGLDDMDELNINEDDWREDR